jgi:hypothetical protein
MAGCFEKLAISGAPNRLNDCVILITHTYTIYRCGRSLSTRRLEPSRDHVRRNFTRTLTWVGRNQFLSLICFSVRVEQEHGDRNYGHTGVKLHFGPLLQHLQNLFFRNNNSKVGTGIQNSVAIFCKSLTFNLLSIVTADKNLLVQCIES